MSNSLKYVANSPGELISQLRNASNPRLGRFGEKIYRFHMENQGYSVQALHEQMADFLVQGLGRVDVKTKGIEKTTVRLKRRIPNTCYCFVDLNEESINLEHEDSNGNLIRGREVVTWPQAYQYWMRLPPLRIERAKTELKNLISSQIFEIKSWIEANWSLRAAGIYREGRNTQESMVRGKNPWGPITFHEPPEARRKIDLKALIYFDSGQIYKLIAYPISNRSEIRWVKGRTNPLSVSFDPLTIDPKFIFSNLLDFKLNFPKRFPRMP